MSSKARAKFHATLSASESHRWIACPGSIRLCADIPNTTNPAASTGIMAHAFVEHGLRDGMRAPEEGAGISYDDHGVIKDGVLDNEMLKAVEVMLERVTELMRDHPKAMLHTEMRVSLEHIRKDMWGTADVIIDAHRQRRLIVIDYKHGFTPVHLVKNKAAVPFMRQNGVLGWRAFLDAEINTQLLMYAAGALNAMELLAEYDEVQVEVVQPRCMEVEPVQTVIIKVAHLKQWATDVLWEAACATEMGDAPLIPGDHCRFCRGASVCPAIANKASELAVIDFQAELINETQLAIPLTAEDLSRILKWAPVIDAWLKELAGHAQRLLEAGTEVPGFKLVRKKSNRAWPAVTEDELVQFFIKAGAKKLKRSELFDKPSLLSPAQLEKVLGKEIVNKVAVKPEGGLTLALESDKRPAATPNNDFENEDLL